MKNIDVNEIEINGARYIRKDHETNNLPVDTGGLSAVLIRTYSAGVHFGYLKRKESTLAGMEVTLVNSRRIWYWDGACSLSQVAVDGVKAPDNCKFSVIVDSIDLVAIEIIPMTQKATDNLYKVSIWKK